VNCLFCLHVAIIVYLACEYSVVNTIHIVDVSFVTDTRSAAHGVINGIHGKSKTRNA